VIVTVDMISVRMGTEKKGRPAPKRSRIGTIVTNENFVITVSAKQPAVFDRLN
jgi:hypothetical protein